MVKREGWWAPTQTLRTKVRPDTQRRERPGTAGVVYSRITGLAEAEDTDNCVICGITSKRLAKNIHVIACVRHHSVH